MKNGLKIIITILITCSIFTSCSGSKNSDDGNEKKAKSTDSYSSYDNSYNNSNQKKSDYTNNNSFTNKYGTANTKCSVSGCNNYIASSGDTNCCAKHSNTCLECGKYIDGDAMYCMTCLSSAINNSTSSSSGSYENSKNDYAANSNECYVCGGKAYTKYGSYYYCSDCLALVKALSN